MAKQGITRSLIGGAAGRPRFVVTKGRRLCKRCQQHILEQTRCVEVPIPHTVYTRSYCFSCFSEVLQRSRCDLDKLERQTKALSDSCS
jgi:hypothetical protein